MKKCFNLLICCTVALLLLACGKAETGVVPGSGFTDAIAHYGPYQIGGVTLWIDVTLDEGNDCCYLILGNDRNIVGMTPWLDSEGQPIDFDETLEDLSNQKGRFILLEDTYNLSKFRNTYLKAGIIVDSWTDVKYLIILDELTGTPTAFTGYYEF